MPAVSKKFGALSSKMKSPLSAQARRPENDVMICRLGTFFTLIPAFSKTNARPLCVAAVSSRSSIFSAVGPSSRLPCTVGVTECPCRVLSAAGRWFYQPNCPRFCRTGSIRRGAGDGERVRQQHTVILIGVHTRRVDDGARFDLALFGFENIEVVFAADILHAAL